MTENRSILFCVIAANNQIVGKVDFA